MIGDGWWVGDYLRSSRRRINVTPRSVRRKRRSGRIPLRYSLRHRSLANVWEPVAVVCRVFYRIESFPSQTSAVGATDVLFCSSCSFSFLGALGFPGLFFVSSLSFCVASESCGNWQVKYAHEANTSTYINPSLRVSVVPVTQMGGMTQIFWYLTNKAREDTGRETYTWRCLFESCSSETVTSRLWCLLADFYKLTDSQGPIS